MVDAGDLATIATGSAVIVALVVGFAQVRATQRQRRDQAAVEIIHDLVDAEFIRGMRAIMNLPPEGSAQAVRQAGPALEDAIAIADFRTESLGMLVFHRVIPLDQVDDLCGGMVLLGWKRIAPYIEEVRKEKGWPTYGEWWQWLAQQLERERRKRAPAHVAYAAWRA
jgi:hypothetical protein